MYATLALNTVLGRTANQNYLQSRYFMNILAFVKTVTNSVNFDHGVIHELFSKQVNPMVYIHLLPYGFKHYRLTWTFKEKLA